MSRPEDAADLRGRVHTAVLAWYAVAGRDLPWRHPDCSPWGVYVSEIMAQQTPIARILAPWQAWMTRWPTPAALAVASRADILRAWDRLGYPRRAVNLHEAAKVMVERHAGQVPTDPDDLRALPGVGDYTVAAVASFAFGRPLPVLDTNVRRVLARIAQGVAQAAPTPTRTERELAAAWMPTDPADANRWNVASMELGALVCTARAPRCETCPVRDLCRWRAVGHPAYAGVRKRPQGYAGTDREVRGRILALVRGHDAPRPRGDFDGCGESGRVDKLLAALMADGLLAHSREGYHLPR